jgi:hypothetical protein
VRSQTPNLSSSPRDVHVAVAFDDASKRRNSEEEEEAERLTEKVQVSIAQSTHFKAAKHHQSDLTRQPGGE